jgi:serine/threonine protein kinase
MAPEVIMRGEITRKVDVYAFGIVLWEILTRTEAFPHHNDLRRFATAICRRDERPVRPLTAFQPQRPRPFCDHFVLTPAQPIPEGTPASLAALMQECWHPQADQRPYFDEIVQRLKCIIEECEQLEAQMLIERHVRDENGARLWGCHFLSRVPTLPCSFLPALPYFISPVSLHLSVPRKCLMACC